MKIKARKKKVSFRDRLSTLTYYTACQTLGSEGAQLIRDGAQRFEINIQGDVFLGNDLFRVRVRDPEVAGGIAVATITEMSSAPRKLRFNCDKCASTCEHVGAAFSVILEDRLALGLSATPDLDLPLENLTESELIERAIAERRLRSQQEKMTLRSVDPNAPWTDYTITSFQSGKTYRVALRGAEPGESYCSCPDFRTNHLGTCKHILHALAKVQKRFSAAQLGQPYRRKNISLRVDYGPQTGLKFNVPAKLVPEALAIVKPFHEQPLVNVSDAVQRIARLQRLGHEVHVYPDAEELIDQQSLLDRLRQTTDDIRRDPAKHPLRRSLLKTELLPYQLDGVAFAVGAGRAILADDMGLGKTIQGIGVAELLAQLASIQRVLVICPASLKSQWRAEIHRFSNRSCQLVVGSSDERATQYRSDAFFTVCNYEQVLRDTNPIEQIPWDLIILDEGQRIKNWEAKTSRVIKSLRSRFALVLSGTPLENRLDELFTVVGFVDDRRLGPAYRFLHRHRVVDENGRVLGYKNLDQLRENLRPILLRRTRESVMQQLPERSTEIVRIRPTEEQLGIHASTMKAVKQIVDKKYLTEMDLLRLQMLLQKARMVADSTYLVDKQEPEYSSKLERLAELLEQLSQEPDRKTILFSEWTTMLDRIEGILKPLKCDFVRLDGGVPQKKRPEIVHRFQTDPDCRVILMTNAGSTGLNLQAANTVINVDLPWNPAVLEQRIARAHRMGQKRAVQTFLLITEETIEERLLQVIAAKKDLALAALDSESDVTQVAISSGMEELKRRLELLLGHPQTAPIDVSRKLEVENQTEHIHARRERIAAASGQLLGAAFELLGEIVSDGNRPEPDPAAIDRIRAGLAGCTQRDEAGRPTLTITLDSESALQSLAASLAKLLTHATTSPSPFQPAD
jgi:superfamily II DNA or RNA helicase